MNQSNSSTSAFYTLDGCVSQNLDETFQALLKVRQGDSKLWQELVKDEAFSSRLKQQGLDEIDDRNLITWDDATLWFTSCTNAEQGFNTDYARREQEPGEIWPVPAPYWFIFTVYFRQYYCQFPVNQKDCIRI